MDCERRPGQFILANYVQLCAVRYPKFTLLFQVNIQVLKFAINLFVKSFFNVLCSFNASNAMNKLSAPDGVVRTYLTAKSIDGHDADAVRIRVD